MTPFLVSEKLNFTFDFAKYFSFILRKICLIFQILLDQQQQQQQQQAAAEEAEMMRQQQLAIMQQQQEAAHKEEQQKFIQHQMQTGKPTTIISTLSFLCGLTTILFSL